MYAPILFTSAKTRVGLPKLFPLLDSVARNRVRRIPTKELLRWFENVAPKAPGSVSRSKFVIQAKDVPPTFVLFHKKPSAIRESDLRYLENNLRATFAFEGTPVRWTTKGEKDEE
jgi:GTP-binding protein